MNFLFETIFLKKYARKHNALEHRRASGAFTHTKHSALDQLRHSGNFSYEILVVR